MFKAGDKIVRKKEYIFPYHEDYGYTGELLTVVSCSGGNVTYTLLNGKLRNGFSENFELHQEKASGDAFNLKTTPWKILVNSPEESRMAQEWLFEQGIEWYIGKEICAPDSPILTNCRKSTLTPEQKILHSVKDDGRDLAPEIKLTFGVTSVEYPELVAKETEAQKKMKELEDKQREIAEELAKLRESM